MKKHTTSETVRYFETDRMKVAHHTAYMVWFENARTDLLKSVGFPYRNMEEDGYLLPVISFSCRITGSSDYGDRLDVDSWVEELRNRTVIFGYHVRKNGASIATGQTKHICIDKDNRFKHIPKEIIEALAPYSKEKP